MGNISIHTGTLQQKTAKIKNQIHTDIVSHNKTKQIQSHIVDSKGTYPTALKQQLQKEEKVVKSIAEVLEGVLNHMNSAAAEIAACDSRYAAGKLDK